MSARACRHVRDLQTYLHANGLAVWCAAWPGASPSISCRQCAATFETALGWSANETAETILAWRDESATPPDEGSGHGDGGA